MEISINDHMDIIVNMSMHMSPVITYFFVGWDVGFDENQIEHFKMVPDEIYFFKILIEKQKKIIRHMSSFIYVEKL